MREVKINGYYRHFKGNFYKVIGLAKDSETTRDMVVYKALYGDEGLWVRNKEMFLSEVDHDRYPDVSQKYRFELLNKTPVEKKFKLIVCDIDSTLANNNHELSDATKKCIAEVRKAGYLFGLASGRPVEDIDSYYKDWGFENQFDVLIGFNGAQVYNDHLKKTDSFNLMKREWIKEVVELLKPFDAVPTIYVDDDKMLMTKISDYLAKSANRIGRKVIVVKDDSELYAKDNAKIMFRTEPENMHLLEEFMAKHPSDNYVCFRTQPNCFEICDKHVNKGLGLQKYCEAEGISLDEVIAFGDTTNDNLMLKCCYGVCMINGTEDTKACAKEITDIDNENNGWADYVYKHLL